MWGCCFTCKVKAFLRVEPGERSQSSVSPSSGRRRISIAMLGSETTGVSATLEDIEEVDGILLIEVPDLCPFCRPDLLDVLAGASTSMTGGF